MRFEKEMDKKKGRIRFEDFSEIIPPSSDDEDLYNFLGEAFNQENLITDEWDMLEDWEEEAEEETVFTIPKENRLEFVFAKGIVSPKKIGFAVSGSRMNFLNMTSPRVNVEQAKEKKKRKKKKIVSKTKRKKVGLVSSKKEKKRKTVATDSFTDREDNKRRQVAMKRQRTQGRFVESEFEFVSVTELI